MFQLLTPTTAKLKSLTPRIEKHGDENVPAVSLGLSITGPNTLLDLFSETLRHALYKAAEDAGDNLPGIDAPTPLLRTRGLEKTPSITGCCGPRNARTATASALTGWTAAACPYGTNPLLERRTQEKTMWTIDPKDPEDGPRYWVVSIQTGSDWVKLTVNTEREARELRDTLNRIAPAVEAWAL